MRIKHQASRIARVVAIAVAGLSIHHGAIAADAWPAKPIKVIVPYTPGGSTDTVARVVFEKVSQSLGQPTRYRWPYRHASAIPPGRG